MKSIRTLAVLVSVFCLSCSLALAGETRAAGSAAPAAQQVLAQEKLDINTADAGQLADGLAGVGPSKAEAIIAYRNANGPFLTVDDLVQVRGIGEATLARNRDRLTVGR